MKGTDGHNEYENEFILGIVEKELKEVELNTQCTPQLTIIF